MGGAEEGEGEGEEEEEDAEDGNGDGEDGEDEDEDEEDEEGCNSFVQLPCGCSRSPLYHCTSAVHRREAVAAAAAVGANGCPRVDSDDTVSPCRSAERQTALPMKPLPPTTST